MTDATEKDLEQDRAIRKLRAEFLLHLNLVKSESANLPARVAAVSDTLKVLDERLAAVEDQLVAEGRMRAKDLLP